MLVKATLGYQCSKKLEEMSADEYAELRVRVPSLPKEKPTNVWSAGPFILDEDGIRALAEYEFDVRLESAVDDCMLVKLQDRIKALELRGNTPDVELAAKGAVVQIHIPDIALMFMNEVTHLDDCCTDALQGYLDEGWRILAVCPPNAQRRPDYILGRNRPRT